VEGGDRTARLEVRLLEHEAERRPLAQREVEAVAVGRDGTLLALEGAGEATALFAPALRARGVVVRLSVGMPTMRALILSPGAAPLEWAHGLSAASIRMAGGRATRIELDGGATSPLLHDGAGWREERGHGALRTTWAGHLLLAADPDVAAHVLEAAAHDERLTRASRAPDRPRGRPRRATRRRPPS
jgi:hypothetical protein